MMVNLDNKKERMHSELKGQLLSSNDHVRQWQRNKMKGDGLTENFEEREKETLGKDHHRQSGHHHSYQKTESPRKKKRNCDKLKLSKSPRKSGLLFDSKPLKKTKMARESHHTRHETKHFRKPTEKIKKRQQSNFNLDLEIADPAKPVLNSAWDHTNYSSVFSTLNSKTCLKDRRTEKREKVRSGNKEYEKKKNKSERVSSGVQTKLIHNNSLQLDFGTKTNENFDEGQAFVIFRRKSGNQCQDSNFLNGYRFEQIAFTRSYKTTFDFGQTKSRRSLSEPRRSLNEIKLNKKIGRPEFDKKSKNSNNYPSFDSFQKSVNFKKEKDVENQIAELFNPMLNCNLKAKEDNAYEMNKQNRVLIWNTKSQTELRPSTKRSEFERLKRAAEKKLNLHRELIRMDKIDRIKFLESIKRSLNYRCATADVFSTQSFISQNESGKYFTSTENSTEIFLRGNVIEKISSYQGFHRYLRPKKDVKNNKECCNVPDSSFNHMRKVFRSMVLKEEDEEEEFHKKRLIPKTVQHTQSATVQEDSKKQPFSEITTMGSTDFSFLSRASEKLTMIENCLSERSSELLSLITKLSQEINNCSNAVQNLCSIEKTMKIGLKGSVSDSKVHQKSKSNKKECKFSTYPVLMFPVSDRKTSVKSQPNPTDNCTKHHASSNSASRQENCRCTKQNASTLTDNNITKRESQRSFMSANSFPSLGKVSTKEGKYIRLQENKRIKKKTLEICCDDCEALKRKILKLEKELEKLEKKIFLYPKEQQDCVKVNLERLKETSETVLGKLRSLARMGYKEPETKKSKRPTSAPPASVKSQEERAVIPKNSKSDYNLNIGMAITMANVDPITGALVHPETDNSAEQEGNIQCKLYTNSEEQPILVLDTDFSYNPKTGMLFKKNEDDSFSLLVPSSTKPKPSPSNTSLDKQPIPSELTLWNAYNCSQTQIKEPFIKKEEPPSKLTREITFNEYDYTISDHSLRKEENSDFSKCPKSEDEIKKNVVVSSCQKCMKMESNSKEKVMIIACEKCQQKTFQVKQPEEIPRERAVSRGTLKSCCKSAEYFEEPTTTKNKKQSKLPRLVSKVPRCKKATPNFFVTRFKETNSKTSVKTDSTCVSRPKNSSSRKSMASEKGKKKSVKKEAKCLEDDPEVVETCKTVNQTKESEKISVGNQTTPLKSLWKWKCKKVDASTQTGVCNSLNLLKQIKKQDAITQTTCYFQTTPTRRMFESFRASAEPLEGFDKESVLKFYNFSVPNVHRASQTDSPAKSSCMINTDSQTKPEKNTLTKYHVGLQANLPTEETLKYMEDLQVQKKVNMAIAELCFHLSKVNEENAEDEDENQKESETEE